MSKKSSTALVVARGAALCVSVGIVALMMVRASAGCSDRAGIGAEPPPASAAGSATASSAGTADGKRGEEEHMGPSKAAGGTGTRALLRSAEPAASSSSGAQKPLPRHFGGSKAAPVFEPGEQNVAPQQQAPQ